MRFDLSRSVPLLILGDGPDQKTGLGRLGHDLAWLLCSMPEFRVGYLGRQAFGRAKFPWVQYSFGAGEQWGEQRIEEAWKDLSQGIKGVILTLWDATRLLWFAQPGEAEEFLTSDRFERWGYFMQDSEGVVRAHLPLTASATMCAYDRLLLASRWAFEMARGCAKDTDWLPHGINRSTFKPIDREYGRSALGVASDVPLIGCVMSNQERKHWPTVFEAFAALPQTARIWIHTDRLLPVPGWGYWNLEALAVEYRIGDRIICESRPLSDTELAMRYSACDATVLISGGEGFGYPVAESLSCGTPVVTGAYGGAAELGTWLVQPCARRIETQHNVARYYYEATEVAKALNEALARGRQPEEQIARVEHLDWQKLGVCWKKWFRKGLHGT